MSLYHKSPSSIQQLFDSDINKDAKKLSRSDSYSSLTENEKNIIKRQSSSDNIMDAPNVEDMPPPYDGKTNQLSSNLSSKADDATIMTTTTTTTITTITTTRVSTNSPFIDIFDFDGGDNSVNEISQTSTSDDNQQSLNKTFPPLSPTKLHSSDNLSPSASASGSLFDGLDPVKLKRQPKRTESAPDIAELFVESKDMSNNQATPHSAAKSMVNLSTLNQRNTSLINKAFPDTPQQYLDKLRDTLSKSELATLLAKSKDVFHEAVLRTYMETFDFHNDPIDIALRKFLLDCCLPKETQQIDRVMEAFAKRYHECNPDVFANSDVAYVLAFAMLMLHTDAFNKSVKRKMTKDEFVNNTRIDGVPREILEILYDNITFARFIYADDDTDVNGQTMLTSPLENRRSRIFSSLKDRRKSSFVRNDPYFVIQHKVPTDFTPLLKDVVPVENIYSYKGTLPELDTVSIHRAVVTAHTVRVTGVRTRGNGESFSPTSSSIHHSDDDDDTFLLKITKAGRLGRKTDMVEGGKKTGFARSWKQFGVVLSGSQLMFFKDDAWFNNNIPNLNYPMKSTVIPTLKPDVIIITVDSVAVYDKSYKKYPNVFRLVCPQGCQYLFQAESESEMNDWIVKINYAATFKTIGLKMRHTWNASLEKDEEMRREKKNIRKPYYNFQQSKEENSSNDVHRRADVLRSKIEELQGKIATLTSQLQTDVRFGNNLALMIPYKATTRDRIIQVATVVGRRIKNICLELSRLVCYHEIMEKELCSTIMGDNTYWQKRKSMHRSDESRAYRRHSNIGNYSYNITEGHNREVVSRPFTMNVPSISSPTPSESELSIQSTNPLATPTTPYTPTSTLDSSSLRLPEFEFEIIGSQDIDGFGDMTKSNFRDDTSSIIDYVCDDFVEPNTVNMEDYNQFDIVEKPKDMFKQTDSNMQTPSVIINYLSSDQDDDEEFVDAKENLND
ncbi:4000_t:CDS:2 [Cetraspora pellucida]|uniref:4000_t:CDS:1 n=1 Tax=Cetraspora pellucida TaxID=1433469 RepID=A0A9N9HRK3_9GLOM|nr:4000_t:CDS:2 [Cetraspora pellucida]